MQLEPRAVWVVSLFVITASIARGDDANWPQFRGTTAGVSEAKGLPVEWDTTKNVAWSIPVPGRGWSCPIVWGNRVFLTSVIRDGAYEDARKGLYFGGERSKVPDVEHRWMVFCYDLATGSLIWERESAKGKPASGIHIKNSYASETPVTDGKRLYVCFGNQGIYCYDLDGKPIWSKKLDPVPTKFSWGTAASPVLYQDRLYYVNDNEKESYLVALDAANGNEVWRVARDEKSNWATPFIWETKDRVEIVTAGTTKFRSYDLAGKVLWELSGASAITIPTPFTRHGLLYLGSGYVMDKNKPLYAIKPGASGDISLKPGETSNQFVAWKQNAAPYNPTPLAYGNEVYVLYDMGFFSAFDAKTGKKLYEKERVEGMYTASPWAYDGKVFLANEDGTTTVVQAGPTFKVLGKNRLDEMIMATPAISGKSLLIRTLTKLYKIEQK